MVIRINRKLFATISLIAVLAFAWAPIISFSKYAYESVTAPNKQEMERLKAESDAEFQTFCDEWIARKGRDPQRDALHGCSNY
jgi:hypothetical protein